MKYLILTLALLVGLSSSINAQEKKEKGKFSLFGKKGNKAKDNTDEKQVIKFGGSNADKNKTAEKSKKSTKAKKKKRNKAKKDKRPWFKPPADKVLNFEDIVEKDLGPDPSNKTVIEADADEPLQEEITGEDYQKQTIDDNTAEEIEEENAPIDITQEIVEGRRSIDFPQKYFISKSERAEYTNYAYLTHKNVDSSNYAIILPKVDEQADFLNARWEKAYKLYQHKYYNHSLQLLLDLAEDLKGKENLGNASIVNYYTGLCYMFGTDNVDKSIPYLHKAALTTDLDFRVAKGLKNTAAPIEAIMYFSMAHLKLGNLALAERYINIYLSIGDRDLNKKDIAYALRGQIQYAYNHANDQASNFVSTPMKSFNTVYHEYYARYTNDGQNIYFLSTGPSTNNGYFAEKADFPNGTFYEKIWYCETRGNAFSEKKLALNTNYKEGFGGFYNNGKSIAYGLRDDLSNGIYTSDYGFEEWQAPSVLVDVENNMSEGTYFTIHPNGNLIVYEHKQPNKDKQDLTKDLYYIYRDSLGASWSSPKALPEKINSLYNEKFPVFSADGSTLYFSSDNDSTFGGYDIFSTQLTAFPNTYSDKVNLGLPFNSHEDDISFAPNPLIAGGIVARKTETSTGGFDLFEVKRGIRERKVSPLTKEEYVRPKRMLLVKNEVSGKSLVLKDSNEQQVSFKARACDTVSITYYEGNKAIKTETFSAPCEANKENLVQAKLSNYPSVLITNY